MMSALRGSVRHAGRVAVRWWLLLGVFPARRFRWRPAPAGAAPVLIALWNRPDRIDEVLRRLDAQDWSDGVRLYLWNNQGRDHARYVRALEQFRPAGALVEVSLVRSPYNLGSISRFYWARRLAKAGEPFVIVLDDDQDVQPEFITKTMARAEEKTVAAWWSWTLSGSYWARVPAGLGDRVDHVGPGGSIADAQLFLNRSFFTEIPDRFGRLDDVWLSWFAPRAGYRLAHLPADIEFVMPETNQAHGQVDVKSEFYDFLRRP